MDSKTLHFTGEPSERQWQYASKFAFGIGKGGYQVRVRSARQKETSSTTGAAKVMVHIFLDEDWERGEPFMPCNSTANQVRKAHKLQELPLNKEWGIWSKGGVQHTMRSHIWYFVVSSCEREAVSLDFQVRMRQEDGSEFSVDQRYMPAVSHLSLLALSAFLIHFAIRCLHFRERVGSLHPVICTLACAAALQWMALALHAFHLRLYQSNGTGAWLAEVVSEVFSILNQTISATLLIAIAQGYTLSCTKVSEISTFRPTAFVVTALQIVLVILDKLQGPAASKHHNHDGMAGWTILAVRVLLYVWFTFGVQSLREASGLKLQVFLQRFQLAATLYFLAYPAILIIVQAFAPYIRQPLMSIGLLAMQIASSFWLANLFLSRGVYFEVSALGASPLPGVGGFFCHNRFKKQS